MGSLLLDVRYALRTFLSRPGFAAIAVATLALGIGVNTVAFSAVDALLLRPFRIADADRIGWIMVSGPENPRGYVTSTELDVLRRGTTSFDAIAAEARVPVSVQHHGGAEQGWALLISVSYLQALGVRPALGRLFQEADTSASELPAVVSHRFWREKLGAPASVGGQTVVVNGRSLSIVGVLPDDFQGPGGLYAPDMWLPLERIDALGIPAGRTGAPWLALFGRLNDGVSHVQAEAELNAAAAAFSPAADHSRRRTAAFHAMEDGHPDLRGIASAAWLALAIVGLVLLIACFNLSALLMARATERRREIGVRCALGAGRVRVLRQLVTEGLLLAAAGGAAALILAAWSESLLATFSLPAPIPQRLHLTVSVTVVWFTLALILIAGVLPSLLPAMHATRADLLPAIHAEPALGGRPSRARSAFVVIQIAGSTVFMVAALLFLRSFVNSASAATGFDIARTAILTIDPTFYGYSGERSRTFFDELRAKLSALPEVRSVALADRVPFYVGYPRTEEYSREETDCAAHDCRRAVIYAAGADHFAALGIPLLEGRDFDTHDLVQGEVVVISRHLAVQLWPGRPAVGQTIRLGTTGEVAHVIGVAADIRHRGMREAPNAYVYRPLRAADYGRPLSVIVRTHADPRRILSALREQVRAIDPALPPASVETMMDRMKMPLWQSRTAAGVLSICAALAVALGSIGLFGVMYFAVSQRTREFGIRAALGATPRRVMTGVVREALGLTLSGVALGAILGYIAGRVLAGQLFGVSPADPATFAATIAIELAVSCLACALPAYRATRVDPLVALRRQ